MIYVSTERFIMYPERYIEMAKDGELIYIVLDNERDSKKELVLMERKVYD